MYAVKEIFYTLQGEGANAGRPAVFCRFAGCNLWSGREEDRAKAQCTFCDTDFVGADAGRFEAAHELADAILAAWPEGHDHRFAVLTGGEPMLQVDQPLVDALHARDFEVAIETNGTIRVPEEIDWICVSPKAGTAVVQLSGDELKLVYPQPGLAPADLAAMDFTFRFLQPLDGPDRDRNTALAVAWCLAHPEWRLSLQTHKILGIP